MTESLSEFSKRKLNETKITTTPTKLTAIRHKNNVLRTLKQNEPDRRFKIKKLSPDDPPIAGYTGHIPRIKGNEESLSQRYDIVVRRGLKLLNDEMKKRYTLNKEDVVVCK